MVGLEGYALGYEIYEGNIYEGHTLIPFMEKIQKRFNQKKPIIVADSGLLSQENITSLESKGYMYIIGARIKSESKVIKSSILSVIEKKEGSIKIIDKDKGKKLLISYSEKRSKRDKYNREKGLLRLEKQIKGNKLTKSNLNKRGYNKYLKMKGKLEVEIDYEKFKEDGKWDGLKGYITNSNLSNEAVIENYNNLWIIEKAFRMSNTDLKIRPIYHRLKNRIEAHVCISFTAYSIYKELERILKKENSSISVNKAKELTHNMYKISIYLPESKKQEEITLKMTEEQMELINIVEKYI